MGDLATEEANEMLTGTEAGTYFIRFSSTGALASSFVDFQNIIRHVLIQREKGVFKATGHENIPFTSLSQLVQFYSQQNIFKSSLKVFLFFTKIHKNSGKI
jgi:hypothetical protein